MTEALGRDVPLCQQGAGRHSAEVVEEVESGPARHTHTSTAVLGSPWDTVEGSGRTLGAAR